MNKLFVEAIKSDYYTPRIKAEVIFDTLLTPFIEEIVSTAVDRSNLKLIAKEFPILTERIKEMQQIGNETEDTEIMVDSKRSICIDYLLSDPTTLYLVELKTVHKSYRDKQHESYKTIKNSNNGAKYLYEDFKKFLYYGKKGKEIFENFEQNSLAMPIPEKSGASATVILQKILNQEYHHNEEALLQDINKYEANDRKYLWQLYKLLITSEKQKLVDVFYKENENGQSTNEFKESVIVYIVPEANNSAGVISLNEITKAKLKFNNREVGYLKRTVDEFNNGWASFQEIWCSLMKMEKSGNNSYPITRNQPYP